MVKRAVLPQPTEDPTLQPARVLKEAAVPEKPMLEQALPHVEDPYWSSLLLKVCTLWYEPIAEAVLQELQSVGRSHDRTVHEGLHPMGGTPSWSREKDDEQGVVEKNS